MTKTCLHWLLTLFVALAMAGLPATSQAEPLDILLDVKSKFSDGCLSIQNLAELAQHRGVNGIVVADHERVSLEYGFSPFERIFKKKESGPSILENGASTYLAEIRQVNESFPKVLVIPGVESSPFYYWSGSLFDDDLVAHNWDKHLLIVGFNSVEDYDQLPTLNSNLSWRYTSKFQWIFFAYVGLTIACLVLFFKKKWPKLSIMAAVLFVLLAFNHHPLRSSPFDPYQGDLGSAPYQETIDYARERGALVFWNHLESPESNGDRKAGAMQVNTPLHPKDLMSTSNYSGFQVLDDVPVPATEPGKEWDQVLKEYVLGKRTHPVWGFGANDFHCEDQSGRKLGAVRTVVEVSKKDTASVLNALRLGHMYSVTQKHEDSRLALNEFVVMDKAKGAKAGAGESLNSTDFPEIKIALASTGNKETQAQMSVIRNGVVVKQESVALPYKGEWRDVEVPLTEPVFYRLAVEAEGSGRLLSNPVFVKFQKSKDPETQTADANLAKAMKNLSSLKFPKVPKAPGANPPAIKPPSTPAPPKMPSAPPVSETLKVAKASAVKVPSVSTPTVKAPTAPKVELPSTTVAPPESTPPALSKKKLRFSKLKKLTLRKGPGAKFPKVATAGKDESLELVRETKVLLDGKPWVVVKKGERKGYVWSGFLKKP